MTEKLVPCEVYDRIVGYYRPKRRGSEGLWNPGALKMADDRRRFRPFDRDMGGWQDAPDREEAIEWAVV